MADEQAKSHLSVMVDQLQDTAPTGKNEKETLKGQMSVVQSVVAGKQREAVKSHHASVHKSEHRPEAIELTSLQIEKKRGVIIPSSQPIPADVKSIHSTDSDTEHDKDSIKQDAKEGGKKHKHDKIKENDLEWSDDEEACGLPRSESRASRVSRAVQKMFCCGVTYEAPSEEDVSSPSCRHYGNAI